MRSFYWQDLGTLYKIGVVTSLNHVFIVTCDYSNASCCILCVHSTTTHSLLMRCDLLECKSLISIESKSHKLASVTRISYILFVTLSLLVFCGKQLCSFLESSWTQFPPCQTSLQTLTGSGMCRCQTTLEEEKSSSERKDV